MTTDPTPSRSQMTSGSDFERDAAGLARLMLIKIAMQHSALSGPLLERRLLFVREQPIFDSRSIKSKKPAPAYADFSLRSRSGDTQSVHVVGEIKWTDANQDSLRNAQAQLNKAFASTVNAAKESRSAIAMIILGWSTRSESDLDKLMKHAKHLVATPAGSDNELESEERRLRLDEDGQTRGAIIDLSLAHPVPEMLGASRWIFVIVRATRTVDALSTWLTGEVSKATDELGRLLLQRWIPQAASLTGDYATPSGATFDLIPDALEGAPAPADDAAATRALLGFMLDPWGKLTRDYVQIARLGERQRTCWSTLISKAIPGTESRTLKQMRQMMANYIPPMPVNLGIIKGGMVVPLFRYFNSSGETAPPGSVYGPPVSILEGGSGSGKTTLVEYLYGLWTDALAIGEDLIEVRELPVFVPIERLKEEYLHGDAAIDAVHTLCQAAVRGELQSRALQYNYVATTTTPTRSGVLPALLQRIPICLLVDGYDQLRDLRDAFKIFANRLKDSGIIIRRIVLTSRPDFGATNAMDWPKVLTLGSPSEGSMPHSRSLICEYVVAPPDESASKAFIESWFKAARELLQRDIDKYSFDGFEKWLRQEKKNGEGAPLKAGQIVATESLWPRISRSPLHTTLALIAYLACDESQTFETMADLFEPLFFKLAPLSSTGNKTQGEPTLVARKEERAILECIAFGMLMRSDCIVGEFAVSDILSHVQAATDGTPLTALGALHKLANPPPVNDSESLGWLHDLPFLSAQTTGERNSFVFLHASIEEYLAAGHLKRFMKVNFNGGMLKVPDTQGIPVAAGQLTVSAGDIRGTALGDIVVRLGRDTFKYLVAQLRQDSRDEAGRRLVQHFFAACARDVSLQQYLYDTGYVDVAIDELILIDDVLRYGKPYSQDAEVVRLSKIALQKFIGHAQYGVSDEPNANKKLEELVPSSQATQGRLDRWYTLFAQDHLFNRSAAPVYQQNFESMLPAALSLHDPVTPSTEDLLYVLRAAHYYGHLGNHTVSRCDYLADKWASGRGGIDWSAVRVEITQGLAYYTAAIELRRVALWLTMPDWFEQRSELTEATDGGVLFDHWHTPMEAARLDPSIMCERFVGPSQAVGDIANQHCAAATLHLWQWLAALSEGQTEMATAALTQARTSADRMRKMWRLSGEPQLRAIRGEGAIKYELYTPGLEEKLAMAELVTQGRAGSKLSALQQSERRVRQRLADLEHTLGLRYGIANQRVPVSLRIFVKTLAAAKLLHE